MSTSRGRGLRVCPATGKVRHRDEITAKMALARIKARDNASRAKTERRPLPCRHCRGWHLTSKRGSGTSAKGG